MDEPPRNEIRKALRRLALATAGLYLISVSLFAFTAFIDHQNDEAANEAIVAIQELAVETNAEADKTHDALCVYVTGLYEQVEASEDFLKRYPNGIQGISEADIQAGIDRQQKAIDSLAGLECKIGEEDE
jgi:hypothetical protein